MFIFKSTGKRANPYAAFTSEDGTRYSRIPNELLEEIPDPQPPEDFSDEIYYRTEQDDAPYVVYTKKSDEQIKAVQNGKVLSQIASLETTSLMPRVVREYLLSDFVAKAAEQQITLEQLLDSTSAHYAPGFVRMYEFNESIKALRAQLT